MRLELWKHFFLSLLLPGALAVGITLYAIVNIGKISQRVSLIEVADDINLNLRELRRYEKNILLLYEEDNVRTFNAYLDQIERRVGARRAEMLAVMSPESYDSLQDAFIEYKDAAKGIIRGVELKKRLQEEIRPLGRTVEVAARDREQALDLRRHEKNFLIYRETRALDELHRIAREMAARQPGIERPLRAYVIVVDAIADKQKVKGGKWRPGPRRNTSRRPSPFSCLATRWAQPPCRIDPHMWNSIGPSVPISKRSA